MATKFKITGPGLYKRRDDSTANLVDDHNNGVWRDTYTNYLYYEDGYYGSEPDKSPNDIVAKVAEEGAEQTKPEPPGVLEMSKMFLFSPQSAIEYVPDRLVVATKILAALLSSNKYDPHFYDVAITDAVELTDKLIMRVKETRP